MKEVADMAIEINGLQKRDFNKAIHFAIKGMNFKDYSDSKFVLNLYGRYFLYDELNRATQVIAAYDGDRLAGLLLADMKGEPKKYRSFWRGLYIKVIDAIQHVFFREGVESYDDTNQQMYKAYARNHNLDGEICFLAADPDHKVKGVGTILLNELERREKDKRIYLYTDSNCTWQFYEHRGFERVGEKVIELELPGKDDKPFACYLYSKVCG